MIEKLLPVWVRDLFYDDPQTRIKILEECVDRLCDHVELYGHHHDECDYLKTSNRTCSCGFGKVQAELMLFRITERNDDGPR